MGIGHPAALLIAYAVMASRAIMVLVECCIVLMCCEVEVVGRLMIELLEG